MRRQGSWVKAARWLAIWAAFTVFMRLATGLADVYRGWLVTAVTSASVVGCWYLVTWVRSRGERRAEAR